MIKGLERKWKGLKSFFITILCLISRIIYQKQISYSQHFKLQIQSLPVIGQVYCLYTEIFCTGYANAAPNRAVCVLFIKVKSGKETGRG